MKDGLPGKKPRLMLPPPVCDDDYTDDIGAVRPAQEILEAGVDVALPPDDLGNMDLGLESGQVTEEDLEKAKSMVPKALEPYVVELAQHGKGVCSMPRVRFTRFSLD